MRLRAAPRWLIQLFNVAGWVLLLVAIGLLLSRRAELLNLCPWLIGWAYLAWLIRAALLLTLPKNEREGVWPAQASIALASLVLAQVISLRSSRDIARGADRRDSLRVARDDSVRTRQTKLQEEAVARSVLQEFKTNHGIATENIAILQKELGYLLKRSRGTVPLDEFYEGAGASLYRNIPEVFLLPDSVRHRVHSIILGTHTIGGRIRFREEFKMTQFAQPKGQEASDSTLAALARMDRDLISGLNSLNWLMTHPDTIWTMRTSLQPADKRP